MTANPPHTPPADLEVWILAGQSNMEGVGELTLALPPSTEVWSFTSAGHWEPAADPLHRFWESFTPIHRNLARAGLPPERRQLGDAELAQLVARERRYGAGLGLAFGQALAAARGRPIGLLPCAHGATTLEQWSWRRRDQGGASLYGAMCERLRRAGGRLAGLLWYQGESEGWNEVAAASYGTDFATWIDHLRADLDRPQLPVIAVQIGRTTLDSPRASAWNAVQLAQYELPLRVAATAVTSAIDLPLVDCIHINARGLQRLGRRLARLALALEANPALPPGPRLCGASFGTEPPDRGLTRLEFSDVAGTWQPADNMTGFEVLDPAGLAHPLNHFINAWPDPADGTAILVRTNLPLQPGETIAYGYGLRPCCNVVDAADLPLCVCRATYPPQP